MNTPKEIAKELRAKAAIPNQIPVEVLLAAADIVAKSHLPLAPEPPLLGNRCGKTLMNRYELNA